MNVYKKISSRLKRYLIDLPQLIRDLNNYLVIRRAISNVSDTTGFRNLHLKHNWFYQPYTFINMSFSEIQEEDEIVLGLFKERLLPTSVYMSKLKIDDLLFPRTIKIVNSKKGICGYLVKYKPIFIELKFFKIFRFVLVAYLVYSLISYIVPVFNNFMSNFG